MFFNARFSIARFWYDEYVDFDLRKESLYIVHSCLGRGDDLKLFACSIDWRFWLYIFWWEISVSDSPKIRSFPLRVRNCIPSEMLKSFTLKDSLAFKTLVLIGRRGPLARFIWDFTFVDIFGMVRRFWVESVYVCIFMANNRRATQNPNNLNTACMFDPGHSI